jgi:hypothetical protein
MIPEEVFHYTKRETALEKILFDKKIELRQIQYTNDPRESKDRNFGVVYNRPPSGTRLPREKLIEIVNRANTVIKKEWKVFCVSQHHPDYNFHTDEVVHPFLRGDCRPRMWATYAENHQGACLKFNGSKLDERLREKFGDSNVFCDSIYYNDVQATTWPVIHLQNIDKLDLDLEETIRDHFVKSWRELFLIKSEDWKTEFEYRWLVHSLNDAPEDISIDGVIEGVLVGQDFPKACWPSLKELCKKLNIPAGLIEWESGFPYILPEKIHKPKFINSKLRLP